MLSTYKKKPRERYLVILIDLSPDKPKAVGSPLAKWEDKELRGITNGDCHGMIGRIRMLGIMRGGTSGSKILALLMGGCGYHHREEELASL